MGKRTKAESKDFRWNDLQQALCKYNKIIFVDVDNVTSKQISIMRKGLRAIDSKMLMGKNTHMKAAIKDLLLEPTEDMEDYAERKANWKPRPHLNMVSDMCSGNVGMVFSNGDLTEVKTILDSQVREVPARAGQLAPKQVIVPPGPTGMDPKQTGFFQALNIATKIQKGQIEIVNEVVVINEGDKVSMSQAALLDKLKICPFEYKMECIKFMDNGKMFPAAVLSITPEEIRATLASNAQNLTAISLATGYAIPSAAPHMVFNAFKNLACTALGAGYSFPLLDAMKSAAASGPATGATTAKVAEKEAEPEKEESDEEVDMGGMFGDDDY